MSHYSIYKVALTGVSIDILKHAITSFARQIGAEIVSSVKWKEDYGRTVEIGLKTRTLRNGIGFGVDSTGALTVHGYKEGQPAEFERVATLAQNYIKAFKVAQNARTMYPAPTMQMKVLEKEVILEVCTQ